MPANLRVIRIIIAVIAGAVASILLISVMRNYILAILIGMLVAEIVSNPKTPAEFALTGFLSGAGAGIYLGAAKIIDWISITGFNILVVMLFTGLLCSGYGYLVGKLQQVLQKGYGPFV